MEAQILNKILEQQKNAEEQLARRRLLIEARIQEQLESDIRATREEQSRKDYEFALRLAQDSNEVSINRSETVAFQRKPDLSKWKFPELRDAINTSCDVELLKACKAEFHRRLEAYHAWRSKNNRKTVVHGQPQTRSVNYIFSSEASRTSSITSGGAKASLNNLSISTCERYFRIPFSVPTGSERRLPRYEQGCGWWMAHFVGEWIVRQLEVHPPRPPRLLEAGKDDLSMCELTLEETGLARKNGAEISAADFEREWSRHGGKAYVYHYILCTQLAFVKTSVGRR